MRRQKFDSLAGCLTLFIVLSPSYVALAQVGGGRGEPPRANQAAENRATLAVPTEEPKKAIALTVWLLTISHSAAAEVDQETGELEDQANNLPTVVGSTEAVRDFIGRLKIAGLLRKSREIRILTLDGQTASVQSGGDQPTVAGVTISQVGTTNNIMYRSVGTIVEATPLIDSTGLIQVSLKFSASHIEKSADVPLSELTDRKPTMADDIASRQLNTIVRVKSGTAVLVGSDATQEDVGENSEGETELIILAAAIENI